MLLLSQVYRLPLFTSLKDPEPDAHNGGRESFITD